MGNCKICGAKFDMMGAGLAGMMITPNCRCGKIRKKIREGGCADCGGHMIDITKTDFINIFDVKCRDCGLEWSYIEDNDVQ